MKHLKELSLLHNALATDFFVVSNSAQIFYISTGHNIEVFIRQSMNEEDKKIKNKSRSNTTGIISALHLFFKRAI